MGSQRLSGRRRSGRSEEGSIDELSSLTHSLEKNKPTEPVRTEFEEEPTKLKRRGRPSKKDKKSDIPEDVMEAMREINGLRGRKSSKADDKIPQSMSVQPTGSDFHSRDISEEEEAEAEEEAPSVSSKGHSLIVKSRDSKNKMSLVIKPIRSSTEERLESSTEETPESMS